MSRVVALVNWYRGQLRESFERLEAGRPKENRKVVDNIRRRVGEFEREFNDLLTMITGDYGEIGKPLVNYVHKIRAFCIEKEAVRGHTKKR